MCQSGFINCSNCSTLTRDTDSGEGHPCVGRWINRNSLLSTQFFGEPKTTLIYKISYKNRTYPVGKTETTHSLQTLLVDMRTNTNLWRGTPDPTNLPTCLPFDSTIQFLGIYGMTYRYAQGYSWQHCLLFQNIGNYLNTQSRIIENKCGTSTQIVCTYSKNQGRSLWLIWCDFSEYTITWEKQSAKSCLRYATPHVRKKRI